MLKLLSLDMAVTFIISAVGLPTTKTYLYQAQLEDSRQQIFTSVKPPWRILGNKSLPLSCPNRGFSATNPYLCQALSLGRRVSGS